MNELKGGEAELGAEAGQGEKQGGKSRGGCGQWEMQLEGDWQSGSRS